MASLTRVFAATGILLVTAGGFAIQGCGPTPPTPVPNPDRPLLPISPWGQGETSTALMPPGFSSSCPQGRTFIAYGNRFIEAVMASKNNSCFGTAGCFSPLVAPNGQIPLGGTTISGAGYDTTPYTTPVPCPTGQVVNQYDYAFTDNQFGRTRISGQEALIHVTLQASNYPTGTARNTPAPGATSGYTCYPYQTQSLFVAVSTDCGTSWNANSKVFDINDPNFEMGYFAANPLTDVGGLGFDRQELYIHPFGPGGSLSTNATPVYISARLIHPNPERGNPPYLTRQALLSSPDGGVTWSPPTFFPNVNEPFAMTTTEDGRWFGLSCPAEGQNPQIHWLDADDFTNLNDNFTTLTYPNCTGGQCSFPCHLDASTGLVDAPRNQSFSVTLSRVQPQLSGTYAGDDCVRAAYPTIFNGVQAIGVVLFCTKTANSTGTQPYRYQGIELITDPQGRPLVQPAFVETDRLIYRPTAGHGDEAALFYYTWPNSSLGSAHLNYVLYRNSTRIGQGELGTGWEPSLVPNGDGTTWMGDYSRGSFFVRNGSLNFFFPFIASDQPTLSYIPPTQNSLVHAGIVSIPQF